MLAATKPVASLLRFWTDSRRDYEDGWIRIEWTGADGVTHTTCGSYWADDNIVNWQYDEPPTRIAEIAVECAASAGEWSIPGAEWQGNETDREMDAVCEAAWDAKEAA